MDGRDDLPGARGPTDYIALSALIIEALSIRASDDEINLCGSAALDRLSQDPEAVLELAQEKLHTWPFRDVPLCWRRLYEDASLYKVARLVRLMANTSDTAGSDDLLYVESDAMSCTLSEIVATLDMGIALSGQPHRKHLFHTVLESLDERTCNTQSTHSSFTTTTEANLSSAALVAKSPALDFEEFQQHLNTTNRPLVMTGVLDQWSALELWQNPNYLLNRTIGGRRLVPVEIGQSYTDHDWTQKMMPFKEYLQSFVLPDEPQEIGYLAQHDLLTQVPALLNDIQIPDYCYTEPPPAPASLPQRPSQLDEPQLNAWFGPKGTRSPLHTDPYYNVLCQVVGHKYVRLYAPEETPSLYARGTDELGIDMANTSQIELSFAERDVVIDNFPALSRAHYQEVILAEGECLFIPAGWWHFIESLTTSFSVSFWWN